MASKQSEALKDLYRGWTAAMAANPAMGLDEIRDLFEHWGDVTVEPGGVDYLEVDAGGVPCMWAVPKACTENRVLICTHGGGYVTGSIPLCADLKGFPPTYVQVGGDETLLDDSLRFVDKAKAAGVEIKCDVEPGMQHVFHFLTGRAPEADQAIARLAAWVKPKLGL